MALEMRSSDFAAEVCNFLLELAALSAAAVLPYFRTALEIEDKGADRFDPVTAADRAVEQVLRAAIGRRYPTHSIVGEEFGEFVGSSSLRWIIDPIDGTRSFMSGIPIWGTLVALCDEAPLFGLMSQAYIGECFIGGNGQTLWRRDGAIRTLATRATSSLSAATLFATTPDMFEPGVEARAFSHLSAQVRMTRYGADCYAYCALAAGQVDLVVEAGLGFHDIAALVPIVEGAGGVVTDWTGKPVRSGGRVLAAANRQLHVLAVSALNAFGT